MLGIEISEHKQKSKQKNKKKAQQKKKLAQTLNKKRSLFFLFSYFCTLLWIYYHIRDF